MLLITGQIIDLFNLECSVPFMQDMLQTILPVLGQLLDKCEDNVAHLNEDESILLQLIVQKYSPATVALLQMDSPRWKLLLRVLSLRTAVYPGHPAPIMTALGQVRRPGFSLKFEVEGECFVVGGTEHFQNLPTKKNRKRDLLVCFSRQL